MNPELSIVVATRDRSSSVIRLLRQLEAQDVSRSAFEIIVVDDGSASPVAAALASLGLSRPLRCLRLEWCGQAAARHAGTQLARGQVLLFVDDDMQVAPDFVGAHLARHRETSRAVVLGRLQSDPAIGRRPLLERFNARQIERQRSAFLDGRAPVRGVHLCTGNVSMRREDYDAVGGFDVTLRRSEDRELGIRLEKSGCRFLYADEAATVHCSDHDDGVWRGRAYQYGRFDRRIAGMHPDMPDAHPWRFWSLIHPLARPVLALPLLSPALGGAVSRAAYGLARVADAVRLRRAAVTLAALCYATEYFRGLRDECGSFAAFLADRPRQSGGGAGAFRAMRAAVRADHDCLRRHRLKYGGEVVAPSSLPFDLVRRIGFQMLAWCRVMTFFASTGLVPLAMVLSRLIRYVYGAEIHWATRIAPGVSIVHGTGLVLSPHAEVGPGCILFQHVTLGESRDPESGQVGAPRLGAGVHVGPGATLLGPIVVGSGTKVAAGSVLMRTVPEDSVVRPADVVVVPRRQHGLRPHSIARVS